MSKPDLFPKTSTAGITVDPKTLDRVVPESRRPDGSVRKQIKIRPGFTPQEDVNRFRGSRQAQMDSTALPKGHIIGWAPPPTSSATQTSSAAKSKSAKKNEKRKEKRKEKAVTAVVEKVKDSWEDDDEDDVATQPSKEGGNGITKSVEVKPSSDGKAGKGSAPDELSEKLEKLEVR